MSPLLPGKGLRHRPVSHISVQFHMTSTSASENAVEPLKLSTLLPSSSSPHPPPPPPSAPGLYHSQKYLQAIRWRHGGREYGGHISRKPFHTRYSVSCFSHQHCFHNDISPRRLRCAALNRRKCRACLRESRLPPPSSSLLFRPGNT